MDFWEIIEKRRSTRKFLNKKIEKEKIEKILTAANLAPSAHNWQSYKIYLIEDETLRQKLVPAACDQEFVGEAPVVLVFVSCPPQSGRSQFYSHQDATIACYQAWLAAVDLGLSAVWVGAFVEEKVKKLLNLPEREIPVAILPIGYAGENPEKTPRKSLEELVTRF